MFGNWKLGSRIGMGFGLLIIVAVGLGGLGAWRMNHEAQAVILLSNELVPEVQVTNELERSAMLAMYNLRGYALSENEQYLQEGSKHLKAVGEQLTKASELADHAATLSVLSAAAKSGRTSVDEYVKLTATTTDNFKAMTADRESMDEAAKRYMDACEAFRSGQHQEVKNDLKVGVNAAQMTARMEKIGLAEEITALGFITRLAVWRAQAEREPEKLRQALRHFDTIVTKISDARALTKQEVHAKELLECETAGLAYKQAVESLHTNMLVAQDLTRRRQAAGDQVVATAKSSASEGLNETDRIVDATSASLSKASKVMLVGLIAAVVLGVIASVVITRGVTGPINHIIEGLASGADQVNAAAGEVAAAAQQLAGGASEQASSLEETSGAMQEMAAMTRTNAGNAREANGRAAQASTGAAEGERTMVRLSEAMTALNESSDKISKIIKVIEEIAFQTNLLALNAAVEAARAGEHGKGFAVVADEVRNLAQRAAQAARETTELIEGTIHNAQGGTEAAGEVGQALAGIVGDVARVSELIGGIAQASDEQAKGVEQVNGAVTQMGKVTQQTASAAEESAAASEELAAQAQAVKSIVAKLAALVQGGNANRTAGPAASNARSA